MILLPAPLIYGQDLSKYRNFSLGMSLARVSKQIGTNSNGPSLIHERPAVIQELTSVSLSSSLRSSDQSDPAPQMIFGFYNGDLYRIEVSYDQRATDGLTAEDMVRAVSALYGTATRPAAEINAPMKTSDGSKQKVIARWEDSQNSVSLFHSSTLDYFGLVVLSKRVDADAEAAIIESAKLDKEEAPQKEADRQKKAADSLEVDRQDSLKKFHP
jgi:beta-lactamase class D